MAYDWGDGKGKVHTVSLAQHTQDVAKAKAKAQSDSQYLQSNIARGTWGGPAALGNVAGQSPFLSATTTKGLNPGTGAPLTQADVNASGGGGGGAAGPDVNPVGDAAYLNATSTSDANYNLRTANDQYGENRTIQDILGYAPGAGGFRDPTTGLINMNAVNGAAFDPSNPFSKMALLSRAYQQQQSQTTNGYAATGQLYSSALQDQRGADSFNNNQNVDSTKKALADALQGYSQDRVGAANDQAAGYRQGGVDRLSYQTGAK